MSRDIHPDDPIGRHLDARARQIHLPRTDVGVIAERAAARTARRHKVTFGVTAALLLAGGTVAVVANQGDDGRTPLATSPDAVVASPLDWTIVDPTTGLGGFAQTPPVIAADGSLYSVSTEPGPALPNVTIPVRTVYRSTDGADWAPLTLPDELYASALAADGNRLYAVGTGPTAGDEIPLRISTSDDDGATWSAPVDLPGLGELQDVGNAGEVLVGRPVVAVHDGTTVVAVTVSAAIDVDDRLPAGIDASNGYNVTAHGVDVVGPAAGCDLETDRAARIQADGRAGSCPPPPVTATLTWDQLGVPPELAALVTPQVHLFTASGDAPFAEVAAPTVAGFYLPALVADADGFTFAGANPVPDGVVDPTPVVSVFTSPDGSTWTQTAELTDFETGGVNTLGVVGGQAVLGGATASTGRTVIDVLGPNGVVDSIDPSVAATDPGSTSTWFGVGGIGPMGWATVLYDADDTAPVEVVHSDATGRTLSAVPIPDELRSWGDINGVTVSADAIVVRFVEKPDPNTGTRGEPARQRLFVGTPRG